jgi:hypothetical protein
MYENMNEKIIDYLLNRLSEKDEKNFEIEISQNKELQNEVELQKLIIETVKLRNLAKEIMSDVDKKEFAKQKRHIQFRRTMTIAWSAAAIFIGVFFINRTVVNNQMDNIYGQYYQVDESSYRGEDIEMEAEFVKAVKLVDKNPEQAQIALKKLYLIQDYKYSEAVRWYFGLTKLKLHNKSEAKKYFEELKESEFYGEKAKSILNKL